MQNKVEVFDDVVIKHNTARFSRGLEWFTEFLSINHNREVRVYELYRRHEIDRLLIPQVYELNSKRIKIERLIEAKDSEISVASLIPVLKEFICLGKGGARNFWDFLSSPTQSVLRGMVRNAKFLGIPTILTTLKHLLMIYFYMPKSGTLYLIHKDLKINQNMIATEKGVYFIDFGSSILTKIYFLADVVELATDHLNNTVDFSLIAALVSELGPENYNVQFLRSQIYLLLIRRVMHFGPADRSNANIMMGVRDFLNELDKLVSTFEI
jgi:hypothetical protein